jgi:cell volume regulation protein A
VIKDLKLPDNTLLLMIARRQKTPSDIWNVLSPRGDTVLRGWDQITILSKVEDEEKVREMLQKAFS